MGQNLSQLAIADVLWPRDREVLGQKRCQHNLRIPTVPELMSVSRRMRIVVELSRLHVGLTQAL